MALVTSEQFLQPDSVYYFSLECPTIFVVFLIKFAALDLRLLREAL